MPLRLAAAALAGGVCVASLSVSSSAVHAQGVNEGTAGAERTRDSAIATAQYHEFSNQGQSESSGDGGGSTEYDCGWYPDRLGTGSDDDPLSIEDLTELWEARPEGRDTVSVLVRCIGPDGLEPDWSAGRQNYQEWSPGVDLEVPVDPAALAQDAWNLIEYPTPVGETSPPLDAGTYAQLPTYFEVNDWAPLMATASAGPVTSTVTATPEGLEFFVNDGEVWYGREHQILGEADCEGGGGGGCVWTPPHSSAGQTSRDPETGEPCFDLIILVRWEVSWTWSNSDNGEGGTTQSLGEAYMGSSTCLVVAEVQAVVDHG